MVQNHKNAKPRFSFFFNCSIFHKLINSGNYKFFNRQYPIYIFDGTSIYYKLAVFGAATFE